MSDARSPEKIIRAKAASLIRRKIITGCTCGCRGDFERVALTPEERAREKQASRDADARALASGEKTPEDLKRENGAFAFPRDRLEIELK